MELVLFIEQINNHSELFKEMKLNMSLKNMLDRKDAVIREMVYYEVKKTEVLDVTDWNDFISKTYHLLATVQLQKETLFQNENHYLPFYAYLCKLLEKAERIPFTARLLEDKHLKNNFSIDIELIESLVEYMYKCRLSEDN